jgi:isoleucyl-tRNA synthetase
MVHFDGLDVTKEIIYAATADEFRRRSCQTVLARMLHGISAVIAPIMPHMAEDIWQRLPFPVDQTSSRSSGAYSLSMELSR